MIELMDMTAAIPIALVWGLLEIIKILISKMSNNKSVLTHKEQNVMADMHRVLSERDLDGTPLCYMPRSLGINQEKLSETQREISINLMKLGLLMERIEKQLEASRND